MMTSIEKANLEKRKEALATVLDAIEGLDEDTQRRVLETAAVFYEIKLKPVMRASVRPGGG